MAALLHSLLTVAGGAGAYWQASWHDLAPDVFEMADAHSGAVREERAAAAALINPEVTPFFPSGHTCTFVPCHRTLGQIGRTAPGMLGSDFSTCVQHAPSNHALLLHCKQQMHRVERILPSECCMQ